MSGRPDVRTSGRPGVRTSGRPYIIATEALYRLPLSKYFFQIRHMALYGYGAEPYRNWAISDQNCDFGGGLKV